MRRVQSHALQLMSLTITTPTTLVITNRGRQGAAAMRGDTSGRFQVRGRVFLGRVVEGQAPVRHPLLDPLTEVRQVAVHGAVGVLTHAGGRGRLAGELLVNQDGAWLDLGRRRPRGLRSVLKLEMLEEDLAVFLVHVDQEVNLRLDVLHLKQWSS